MHIVVSWDINGAGDTWAHINSRLFAVLAPYRPFRPLNTFYVVKVDEAQRRSIISGLQTVAKAALVTTHVVVTPLMHGGAYDGILPEHMWAELNARSAS